MRQVPRSPLSFKLQRVANVPEHPPPSTRLMSCAHIANRRLSRIIGASSGELHHGGHLCGVRASNDPGCPIDVRTFHCHKGTSNNTLLWLSERLRRSCQGGPPIG